VLEISSTLPLEGEITSHYIHPALAVAGVAIRDLPFPGGASVMLILRGRELIPPKGSTVLLPGDHVYVFSRARDRALIQLLFGQQEEG
jgi:cell volume regulation protein A